VVEERVVVAIEARLEQVERILRDTLSLLHDLGERAARLERAVRLVSSLHELQGRVDRLERALRMVIQAQVHDAESRQEKEVRRLARLAGEELGKPSHEVERLFEVVEELVRRRASPGEKQRPPDEGGAPSA